MILFSINSFTTKLNGGNPAGVCLTETALSEESMKTIAAQMNLSETAFVWPEAANYHIRWFTPSGVEVDLCGHATLAASHAIWEVGFYQPKNELIYFSRSGELKAKKVENRIQLNFPIMPVIACNHSELVTAALDVPTVSIQQNESSYYLVELESENAVRNYQPRFTAIENLPLRGLIITAKASNTHYDFVSRFFAPKIGIPEDPVTGVAHTMLATYWQSKLNKDSFVAYQASKRGGTLWLRMEGSRIKIEGETVTFFQTKLISPLK